MERCNATGQNRIQPPAAIQNYKTEIGGKGKGFFLRECPIWGNWGAPLLQATLLQNTEIHLFPKRWQSKSMPGDPLHSYLCPRLLHRWVFISPVLGSLPLECTLVRLASLLPCCSFLPLLGQGALPDHCSWPCERLNLLGTSV